jgi:hypothetical protein
MGCGGRESPQRTPSSVSQVGKPGGEWQTSFLLGELDPPYPDVQRRTSAIVESLGVLTHSRGAGARAEYQGWKLEAGGQGGLASVSALSLVDSSVYQSALSLNYMPARDGLNPVSEALIMGGTGEPTKCG